MYFYYNASGVPVALKYNNVVYYYITNLQGDVVGIVGANGGIVVTYSYDAWGRPLSSTCAGNYDQPLMENNPLRYRGYIYDKETGFYYLQSRYYDPTVRRFINADSPEMALEAGITDENLYAYCDNNPVMRADDGGEFWNVVIGAAVGAVVSGGISIISQMIENVNNGDSIGKINWAKVGVSALGGAVSGGLAASGMLVGGQMVANGIIGAVTSAADTYISSDENTTALDYISNIAIGASIGVIGGFIGGNGTGNNHLTASAGRFLKHSKNALRGVFEKGLGNTFKEISKAGSYYYSQICKQSIQNGIDAIKPIIASNIPNFIYNTKGVINWFYD